MDGEPGVPRLLSYGADAVLLEFDDIAQVRAVDAALVSWASEEIEEIVPAARTILVRYRDAHTAARSRHQLIDLASTAAAVPTGTTPERLVEVTVDYSGEDLDAVAEQSGLSVSEVIDLHTMAEYEVAFCGFAPGFAYLTGLPTALRLPRRSDPRPRVPAGSVAIADIYCAVYPAASPGGWNLLGITELGVWDIGRDPPALMTPGTRVRFLDSARRR
jgi:KipI family sensor histidine kinase inhibitor